MQPVSGDDKIVPRCRTQLCPVHTVRLIYNVAQYTLSTWQPRLRGPVTSVLLLPFIRFRPCHSGSWSHIPAWPTWDKIPVWRPLSSPLIESARIHACTNFLLTSDRSLNGVGSRVHTERLFHAMRCSSSSRFISKLYRIQ